jgi:hypothetical protein
MKTIQINDFITPKTKNKQWKLLKEIYNKFLKEDLSFHYLFEPELIIRLENEEIINKIKEYLNKKHFIFEVYSYPNPKKNRYFGESEKIMQKYNDLFLAIFHQMSLFYMIADQKDQPQFRERVVHIMYNSAQTNMVDEAYRLGNMAVGRGITAGQYMNKV